MIQIKTAQAKKAPYKLLTDNLDPGLAKKEQIRSQRIRAGNTFEAMAREWHNQQKHKWTVTHAERVLISLDANIFPSLGSRPIAEITPAELLDVLRVIEKRDALDMASRVLQRCMAKSRIFEYIETYYNRQRKHSAIGHRIPMLFEEAA